MERLGIHGDTDRYQRRPWQLQLQRQRSQLLRQRQYTDHHGKTALEDTVTITAEKKDSQRRGIITWSDGHYLPGNATLQDLVTYAESVNDPVTGYLHVKVSYGSAKIIKTSEDGIVSGIRFTITGNGVNETVTTGENGEIQIDNLTPGEYTVTELADDRYVPQESKTVCVVSGQTAIVEFRQHS